MNDGGLDGFSSPAESVSSLLRSLEVFLRGGLSFVPERFNLAWLAAILAISPIGCLFLILFGDDAIPAMRLAVAAFLAAARSFSLSYNSRKGGQL
jgi:hypothetical protein